MWQYTVYKQSRNLLRQYYIFLQTVFEGFWLGVLNRDSLVTIDEKFYHGQNMYSSVEYNKKGLTTWETEMINNYFQHCRDLILIGAGGGREVYALQKLGYRVAAFECNSKLQEFGNKFLADEGLVPSISFGERDICPPPGNGKYDGAILGWGSYMLMQGRALRINYLRSLRDQLTDEAPLLLSFYTRSSDDWKLRNIPRIGNVFRLLLRREYLEIGDRFEPTYVHYFSEAQLAGELDEAGFSLSHYSSKSYGHAVAFIKNTE